MAGSFLDVVYRPDEMSLGKQGALLAIMQRYPDHTFTTVGDSFGLPHGNDLGLVSEKVTTFNVGKRSPKLATAGNTPSRGMVMRLKIALNFGIPIAIITGRRVAEILPFLDDIIRGLSDEQRKYLSVMTTTGGYEVEISDYPTIPVEDCTTIWHNTKEGWRKSSQQ